jgi:8-oxo-dGTP pyrophosphatase MutT (NUDIX family)
MSNIKKSYGILCCRPSKLDGIEILMVKRSTTYHFCEFVSGHYRKQNHQHLINLFNNMTYNEKMDILSLKFQNLWYRIYMENPDKVFFQGSNSNSIWASSYIKKKNKFESAFLQDSGKKLQTLIATSTNVETPWEYPKGRKNKDDDTDIDTAIREFQEETGVESNKYNILWHLSPYVETYTDFGVIYQNIYYYATAIDIWNPTYTFSNKVQISEVSSIKWISLNQLIHMNLESTTYKRLLNSFSKILKKYKSNNTNTLNKKQSVRITSLLNNKDLWDQTIICKKKKKGKKQN